MNRFTRSPLGLSFLVMVLAATASALFVAPWTLAGPPDGDSDDRPAAQNGRANSKSTDPKTTPSVAAQIHYLEIVTKDVDDVCAAYAALHRVTFGKPDAALGNARTASLPSGGMIGVRPPMRADEAPVVRPYWLVNDIKSAANAAVKSGGVLALPPMELPGHGTCAIYIQGGVEHGLWQK